MKIQTSILKLLLLLVIIAPAATFAATSGPAPIPPPPNFQITTNVITLCKGMINTVPISIKTPIGAALMQNVQLSITNSKNVYVVGNGSISATNVSANSTKTINLHLFVSLNSSSLVSSGVQINYQYFTLYSDTEVRNVSFGTETCAAPLSIAVLPK